MPIGAFIGLTAAGTAISAIGQVKAGHAQQAAGQAQQAAANSQADLADYNATVADAQAKDALDRGTIEENRFRTAVKGLVGSQRTAFAASGVDVSTGSAVDVQADATKLGELDALTIRTNARLQAWGFKVNAYDLRQGAAIARKTGVYQAQAGEAAQSASYFGAAGTILGAGANLLSTKYGFKTKG
jgi:hypothetical protein